MTEENKRTEETKTIEFCFVTFKCMSGKQKCMTAFADAEFMAEEDPGEEKKKLMGKFIEVEEALPSGCIQWLNIKYPWWNRLIRTIIIWTIAWIIIIGGFILIIYFKDLNDSMVIEASLNTKCPKKLPSVIRVLEDYELAPKQR